MSLWKKLKAPLILFLSWPRRVWPAQLQKNVESPAGKSSSFVVIDIRICAS